MSITAMKQALAALESTHDVGCNKTDDAIASLHQAIEQFEKQGPEPIDHLLAENARLWGLIYDLHKKIAPDTTQAGDGDCTDGERLCAELKTKEQKEPVAWTSDVEFDRETEIIPANQKGRLGTFTLNIPLYTAPQPQREWVGLTDEEIALVCAECAASAHRSDDISFARAIEAKLKEKNGQ